jgi:hypothetical protein
MYYAIIYPYQAITMIKLYPMDDAPIILVPWMHKGVIVSKFLLYVFFFITLLLVLVYLATLPSLLFFSLFCLSALVLLILFVLLCCYYYHQAAHKTVYIFTKETLWIEKRVYKFIPTLKFIFAKGILDDRKHTNSCNTITHELRYLIDPGEDNDVREKQSHFWKGISLIDRRWDYSYDHTTHKDVNLKNIRKVDWDKNSHQITQWISDARRAIANRS